MVGSRVALLIALVGIGACHAAHTRPPTMTDTDAAASIDAGGDGGDATATPDLSIERPPPALEICDNGLDDDGDGKVDEGCVCAQGATQDCYPGPRRLSGVGQCAAGKQVCQGDAEFGSWGPCEDAVTPTPEICDGLDNNCNGVVDDGCLCTPGETRACYGGPSATAHVGSCRDGTQACLVGVGGVGSFWDPAAATFVRTGTSATDSTTTATGPSTTAAPACPTTAAPATAARPGRKGWGPARPATRRA
jgi:Putative metal-binding motif